MGGCYWPSVLWMMVGRCAGLRSGSRSRPPPLHAGLRGSGGARHGSAIALGSTLRPCTVSWPGTVWRDCPGWTVPPAGSFAATNTPRPGRTCTWISNSSGGSPTAEGARHSAGPPGAVTRLARSATAAPGYTSFSTPSTITHALPTPRSSPMRRRKPWPRSVLAPTSGSSPAGSPSSES